MRGTCPRAILCMHWVPLYSPLVLTQRNFGRPAVRCRSWKESCGPEFRARLKSASQAMGRSFTSTEISCQNDSLETELFRWWIASEHETPFNFRQACINIHESPRMENS